MSTNPDFDAFFSQHAEPVVRALTLALADRARAEDAAQEAFAKAYRQWGRVSEMERPVAWVYVVALHGARRVLRRELDAPAPDPLGPAPDLAGAVAVRVSVRESLAMLAPRQRVAVVLRYLADLQVAEVAAAMGCSVGTAKATLHTGLARLRVELGAEGSDETSGAAPPPLDPGLTAPPPPGSVTTGPNRTAIG